MAVVRVDVIPQISHPDLGQQSLATAACQAYSWRGEREKEREREKQTGPRRRNTREREKRECPGANLSINM